MQAQVLEALCAKRMNDQIAAQGKLLRLFTLSGSQCHSTVVLDGHLPSVE
jgi:hypothetical protein